MKIIVTAGGTGGHIYPALGIINKFKEKEKNLEILYIGTHNRMEKDIIPNEGIKYIPLEIYGLTKDIPRNIKNISLIFKAYKKSLKIIKDFNPDIVLGIGGYVTYPVIKAAKKLHVPIFIHEQNSIPGKSNKALEKYANLIGISFASTINYFKDKDKVFLSGNPCGERALSIKPINKDTLGFNKNKKLIVIVSGSLGSMTINKTMKKYLKNVDKNDYQYLYITGKSYYDDFISDASFPQNVKIVPYFNDLSALLKDTDLLISRAGASSISEIIALHLPSILIPSPYVANNHQYYNAIDLVNNHCAVMLEEKELTKEALDLNIKYILDDKKIYNEMKDNLSKISKIDSSELIYNKIKDLIK